MHPSHVKILHNFNGMGSIVNKEVFFSKPVVNEMVPYKLIQLMHMPTLHVELELFFHSKILLSIHETLNLSIFMFHFVFLQVFEQLIDNVWAIGQGLRDYHMRLHIQMEVGIFCTCDKAKADGGCYFSTMPSTIQIYELLNNILLQ